nr:MAG: major capsid protein [Microviridae sp.]
MRKGSGVVPGAPGAAQHTFAAVPSASVQRSVFNRSHGYKTTFQEGYLIPFYCDEAIPGDTFSLKLTAFLRLSTLLFPIMDNMYVDTHYWFVPNRLLWTNWIYMMGEQNNPADSTSFTVPQVTVPGSGFTALQLFDYMGIPPGVATMNKPNALHSRAYNFIWNQEYRDQNLQNSVTVDTGNGPDTASNYVLLQRGKRHDYFTSSLPWTQKVNDGTSLNVPLSGSAPVISSGTSNPIYLIGEGQGSSSIFEWSGSGYTTASGALGSNGNPILLGNGPNGSGMVANLTAASGITVNQLRQSVQLQRMFERDARGGTRYPELIKSHFGVISPDFRLQRPEFLGGNSVPFNIHPVPQTSGTGITGQSTPQGDLAAYGTCSLSGSGFTKSFTEHGVILGIMSIRADLTYQQGVERMWSRQTRYDYAWPVLAHLGEQAVLNQEIYLSGNTTTDSAVFGYQERYAEYRYKPAQVTGEFRSSYSTPLDAWHLAQNFGSLPTLGSTFIVENAPMSRILASGAVTHFLADMFIKLKCARPLPVWSVPGWLDHF